MIFLLKKRNEVEISMSFIEWFLSNWYANCFTIITVVLSGLISLIISAVYYRKGNRNNLRMAVIHPIIRLLQDAYSRKNYDKLNEIAKDYSTRYLTKTEEQKLNSLLMAYKEVSTYNDISVNADILFSYFEYTLKKNQINPKPVPIEYEGEVVYGSYPSDLFYLSQDLEKVLRRYDPNFEPDECKDAIISLYEHYCKEYYTSDKIKYFDDYTLREVLKKSEIRAKWDKKFDVAKEAKEQFLKLKIAQ